MGRQGRDDCLSAPVDSCSSQLEEPQSTQTMVLLTLEIERISEQDVGKRLPGDELQLSSILET